MPALTILARQFQEQLRRLTLRIAAVPNLMLGVLAGPLALPPWTAPRGPLNISLSLTMFAPRLLRGQGNVMVTRQSEDETAEQLAETNRDINNATTITRDTSFDTGNIFIDVGSARRAEDNAAVLKEFGLEISGILPAARQIQEAEANRGNFITGAEAVDFLYLNGILCQVSPDCIALAAYSNTLDFSNASQATLEAFANQAAAEGVPSTSIYKFLKRATNAPLLAAQILFDPTLTPLYDDTHPHITFINDDLVSLTQFGSITEIVSRDGTSLRVQQVGNTIVTAVGGVVIGHIEEETDLSVSSPNNDSFSRVINTSLVEEILQFSDHNSHAFVAQDETGAIIFVTPIRDENGGITFVTPISDDSGGYTVVTPAQNDVDDGIVFTPTPETLPELPGFGEGLEPININDLIFTSDAPQNISIIDQRINNHKEHLTDRDLDAARRELDGEVVAVSPDGTPFDHVGEVRDSQRSLRNIINTINNR